MKPFPRSVPLGPPPRGRQTDQSKAEGTSMPSQVHVPSLVLSVLPVVPGGPRLSPPPLLPLTGPPRPGPGITVVVLAAVGVVRVISAAVRRWRPRRGTGSR